MVANPTQPMDNCFLPENDREYLETKGLQYTEVKEPKQNGLIIENYTLPAGKYNVSTTRLLIIIPQGYNDAHPDMFYCYPTLTLMPGNNPPAATTGAITFNGITWQQWSRHLNTGNDWRAGIDGIGSYLQKVNHALRTA
jgi:hypothetical protein